MGVRAWVFAAATTVIFATSAQERVQAGVYTVRFEALGENGAFVNDGYMGFKWYNAIFLDQTYMAFGGLPDRGNPDLGDAINSNYIRQNVPSNMLGVVIPGPDPFGASSSYAVTLLRAWFTNIDNSKENATVTVSGMFHGTNIGSTTFALTYLKPTLIDLSAIAGADSWTVSSTRRLAVDDIKFQTDFSPGVPEPRTWALMLTGFASLGYIAYRSRRRAQADISPIP